MYERQPQAGGDVNNTDFYTSRPTDLQSLNNSDWQIAQGEPDIRGWLVTDRQKTSVGVINDLLISRQAQQAVFAVVGQGSTAVAGGPVGAGGAGGAGTEGGGMAGAGGGGAPGGGTIGGGGTYGGTYGGAASGGAADTGASGAGAGTFPSPPGMPNMILIPMDRVDLDMNNRQVIFQGDADELVASPAFAENTRQYGDFYEYWAARRPAAEATGAQAAVAAPAAPEHVEAEHVEAMPAREEQPASPATEQVHHEASTLTPGQEAVIPETEERLEIAKHDEHVGTVEVHRDVEMVPETEHATVKRTVVHMEEQAVPSRDVQPGERVLHEGDVIEIPVVEEELIIEKRPRVTKEIVIKPEIVEEEKEVTEQLRKERVQIETKGDAHVEEQTEGLPPVSP